MALREVKGINKDSMGYERSVTFRSMLIATLLTLLNVYWLVQLEVVRYTHPTTIHPLSNVIFILFFLMGASLVLKKISPALPEGVRVHRVRVQEDRDLWSDVYGSDSAG